MDSRKKGTKLSPRSVTPHQLHGPVRVGILPFLSTSTLFLEFDPIQCGIHLWQPVQEALSREPRSFQPSTLGKGLS